MIIISNIKYVIEFCIGLLNTRISFGSYSFTFFQVYIALFVLGIVLCFVKKLLS